MPEETHELGAEAGWENRRRLFHRHTLPQIQSFRSTSRRKLVVCRRVNKERSGEVFQAQVPSPILPKSTSLCACPPSPSYAPSPLGQITPDLLQYVQHRLCASPSYWPAPARPPRAQGLGPQSLLPRRSCPRCEDPGGADDQVCARGREEVRLLLWYGLRGAQELTVALSTGTSSKSPALSSLSPTQSPRNTVSCS